ncbi:MAG: glucose-inhibited division protein B [Epsilonproteobacteria bacterium]|nr:glucose-inhibited division protein B [Campylobacterota bacterium]
MAKIILFAIIGFVIYLLFFKKRVREESSNDLIMCDKCKTFYPKDEILRKNGQNICKECYENSK